MRVLQQFNSGVCVTGAFLIALSCFLAQGQKAPTAVSPGDAQQIGRKIWQNECRGTVEGLTSWNAGEAFPSLGIGHFIWYPVGARGPFEERFPALVAFLRQRGAAIPAWLADGMACPWSNRALFLAEQQSEKMIQLRTLLEQTVSLQAEFAAARLASALPGMTESLAAADRTQVEGQFARMAVSKGGYYPLIDYVNFKGEGTKASERYQGEGWGLLQVLQKMHGAEPGAAALAEFSQSAISLLERRVQLSPPERNEKRWIEGWKKRCRSYCQ